MGFLGYLITIILLRGLALLPGMILYRFADLLYLVLRYLVRYRRKVIQKNLSIAFPNASRSQHRKIIHRYYLHLADLIIENGVLPFYGEKRIRKLFQLHNPELIGDYHEKGRHVILMTGHYNNWEWGSSLALHMNHRILVVYRPLRNPWFDRTYLKARTKLGAEVVNMSAIGRSMFRYSEKQVPVLVGMAADQRPIWQQANFWTDFFNRPTPFFTGSEKLARKFNACVLFLDTEKIKRGRYKASFSLISDDPGSLPEGDITRIFSQRLEEQIRREPAYWLWSHDRWRYSKEEWMQRKAAATN